MQITTVNIKQYKKKLEYKNSKMNMLMTISPTMGVNLKHICEICAYIA